MKTLTVNVTEEDLRGNPNVTIDCPVYRALKKTDRRVRWVEIEVFAITCNKITLTIQLPSPVPSLIDQMIRHRDIPRHPFSFVVEVPDETEYA